MSDYRLYRRQAQLGKVRLLRERLRTGTLASERLELAAYLGEPSACEVLGDATPVASSDLEGWVLGLEDYGREALIRATFAAVRFLHPLWQARYPSDRRLALALDAAEAWADDPSPSQAQRASAAARQAELAAIDAGKAVQAGSAELADEAAAAVAEAVAVVTEVVAGEPASYTRYAAVAAEAVSAWGDEVTGDVREAICAAVAPWALKRG
jgi:hypothetical protein